MNIPCAAWSYRTYFILIILILHQCASIPIQKSKKIIQDEAQDRFVAPPTFPYWGPFGLTSSALFCPFFVGPNGGSWNRACAGPVPPFRPTSATTTTTTTTTPAPAPAPASMAMESMAYSQYQRNPFNYDEFNFPPFQGDSSYFSDDYDLPVTSSPRPPRQYRRRRQHFYNNRKARSSQRPYEMNQEIEPSNSTPLPWAGFMFSLGPFYVEGDMGIWG